MGAVVVDVHKWVLLDEDTRSYEVVATWEEAFSRVLVVELCALGAAVEEPASVLEVDSQI